MPDRVTFDAEAALRAARRPLVIGMGGGGDVVGALATAEHCARYDGAEPVVGGLSWERRPVDPVPGPRTEAEIDGGRRLAPGVLLAGPHTRVRGREIVFGESHMAAFTARPTVIVTLEGGAPGIADGIAGAARELGCDLVVLIDVGGDVLARGDELGLRSPLCDAVLLAAGERLAAAGVPVLLGVFGVGCDAELTEAEVLERFATVAAAGGFGGVRGLTGPVAERLEAAMEHVPTEASAQAVRAFRGVSGLQTIRGGARSLQLTTTAAATFYFDPRIAYTAAAPLAQAVIDCAGLEQANAALNALGVRTELDLEREAAADDPPTPAVG
ncbi:MAG TPA: DUF1152 domain-containing protein [Solirubrobacteraceae bacterium]|nr:DUF1152 domain-containing protein [Solirubrobacteraceae bacterium]